MLPISTFLCFRLLFFLLDCLCLYVYFSFHSSLIKFHFFQSWHVYVFIFLKIILNIFHVFLTNLSHHFAHFLSLFLCVILNSTSISARVEIHSFRSHIRITSFWSGNPRSKSSGIHSQKSDSNHYFGVDSTILSMDIHSKMMWSLIWLLKEWISTPLHCESNLFFMFLYYTSFCQSVSRGVFEFFHLSFFLFHLYPFLFPSLPLTPSISFSKSLSFLFLPFYLFFPFCHFLSPFLPPWSLSFSQWGPLKDFYWQHFKLMNALNEREIK